MVAWRGNADNTQHRTDRAPLWGEAVLLVRPSSRTRSPLKRGSGGALRGVESPHSTPRCISSALGAVLAVGVPLHGDSNLGVEWRPERSYLSEIVLPVMGSGRARYLSSSSSSRLQRGILLICGCYCSVLVFPSPLFFAVSVRVSSAVIFGPCRALLCEYALQDSVM